MGGLPIFYLCILGNITITNDISADTGFVMGASQLEKIIAAVLTALGFEMVSCSLYSYQQNTRLRVLMDGPTGVTVGDCERASKQIYAVLAVEAPTAAQYALEVSSPGLDRPLLTLNHYQRFIDHQVRIKLYESIGDRKNFAGKLLSATAGQTEGLDQIEILVEGETLSLKLENIEKANLIPEVRFKRNEV
jgi:ribosome maturation factor RimP